MFKLLTGTVVAACLALGMLAPAAIAAEASQQTADTVQASITRINVTWETKVFDDLTDSWTNVSFEAQCSGFISFLSFRSRMQRYAGTRTVLPSRARTA